MLGRLVHSADFERMRLAPTWSRSAHFAVYHLAAAPSRLGRASPGRSGPELSTEDALKSVSPVDDLPRQHWLGTMLPKRLARDAVTRNLLRRQIRCALSRHLTTLPPGLWVVRLRATFARRDFVSAASDRLRRAARQELDGMLGAQRLQR